LGDCFANLPFQDAQAKCAENPACEGFSFSSGTTTGGGCFKQNCATTCQNGVGTGDYDYFAKVKGSDYIYLIDEAPVDQVDQDFEGEEDTIVDQ
jgi:hypothetical protein